MKIMEKALKDLTCQAFGSFIKKGRERRNLVQADVAEMVGISPSHYASIERGRREAKFVLALEICAALKLDINDFVESQRDRKIP